MVHVAVPRRPGHEFDPWTFSDLHDLPYDGWRYEIVDGSLTMTPPPGVRHEFVSAQLLLILSRAVPGSHTVLGPVGLDLHPSYRTPDLCVIPRKVVRDDGELVTPADVLLAIEVVSPGSVTTDRVTKPAQYAKAGIPAYWRVETRPQVSLTAYTLRAGEDVYSELGSWHQGVAHLQQPFFVDVPLAELTP